MCPTSTWQRYRLQSIVFIGSLHRNTKMSSKNLLVLPWTLHFLWLWRAPFHVIWHFHMTYLLTLLLFYLLYWTVEFTGVAGILVWNSKGFIVRKKLPLVKDSRVAWQTALTWRNLRRLQLMDLSLICHYFIGIIQMNKYLVGLKNSSFGAREQNLSIHKPKKYWFIVYL